MYVLSLIYFCSGKYIPLSLTFLNDILLLLIMLLNLWLTGEPKKLDLVQYFMHMCILPTISF